MHPCFADLVVWSEIEHGNPTVPWDWRHASERWRTFNLIVVFFNWSWLFLWIYEVMIEPLVLAVNLRLLRESVHNSKMPWICFIKACFHFTNVNVSLLMWEKIDFNCVGLGLDSDIYILIPFEFGSGSITSLPDAGRARTEKCGPFLALVGDDAFPIQTFHLRPLTKAA